MNFWNPFIRIASRVASKGRIAKQLGPRRTISDIMNPKWTVTKGTLRDATGRTRRDDRITTTWVSAEDGYKPFRSTDTMKDLLKRPMDSQLGLYGGRTGAPKRIVHQQRKSISYGPFFKKTEKTDVLRPVESLRPDRGYGVERMMPRVERTSYGVGIPFGRSVTVPHRAVRAIKKHKVATAVGAKTAAVSAAAAAASQRKKPTTRVGTAYRPRRIPKNPKKGRR